MRKQYKVALVSAGMITNAAHIPAYLNRPDAFRLCGIYDIREQAARETAQRHGIPGVFTDYEQMLKEVQPDIVSVCTPNLFHGEQTILALQYGAHVICEKPLSLSYAEAAAIFAEAKKAGRYVIPCQSMRYSHEFWTAKKLSEQADLGDIYFAEVSWVRRRGIPTWGMFHMKERSGGGCFCDLGVHMMDALMWITGSPRLQSVSGSTAARLAAQPNQLLTSLKDSGAPTGVFTPRPYDNKEFNVEEFASGCLRFAGGLSVNFKIAWALNHPDEMKLSILGENAGLLVPEMKVVGHMGPYQADIAPVVFHDSPYADKAFPGHWHLFDEILPALDGEKEPPVTEAEALNVVAIIDGFYKSAAAGREISMDEIVSGI